MESAISLAASVKRTGLGASDEAPRVVVVASISGGTGSGMVADVGYAVRKVLAELGHTAEARQSLQQGIAIAQKVGDTHAEGEMTAYLEEL